jgi:phage shock protein PspC (stress-responsive transcriptional regulator)
MTMEPSPGTIPGPGATPHRAPRRFHRSSTNRVFSGVCGGVAEYFGGDATMVRLATVIIGLMTAIIPMIIVYVVIAIVVPERGYDEVTGTATGPIATPRPRSNGNGAMVVGLLFIAIGVAGFAREVLRVDWDLIWPFALIGIGAAFILMTVRREPPPRG